MKKFLAVVAVALTIVLGVCSCDSGSGSGFGSGIGSGLQKNIAYQNQLEKFDEDFYPLYHSLNEEEKELYAAICTTIENYSTSAVFIGEYTSKAAADTAVDWIDSIYRQLIYEHPEYFWVDPYNFTINQVESGNEYRLSLNVSYIIDKEAALAKKEIFDRKVDEIVRNAEAMPELFDKVLYVYDYILENAQYDYDLVDSDDTSDLGRSAYGCLVDGKTICSGYTLAFTLLMQKLGIAGGVEFNNYDNFSIISGHVWNYCKLEGEYYYFDLTWDDTVLDSAEYKPYIDHSHMYFGITKDELSKSNYTMATDAPTPACNGTKYNYFAYNNWNFSQYEFEAVKNAIVSQADNQYVALRFDSYGELLNAEQELLTEGQIYSILQGKENIRYVISNASLHLYIFFDSIG